MKQAFTLLELIVVLLLISLLAGLIFPRLVSFIPKEDIFLYQAANFIEGARIKALHQHQDILLVFDPQNRTLSLRLLTKGGQKKLQQSLVVPEEIEIKAHGLLALPENNWGILFLANGASTGGEVEIIDHANQRRLVCRLARSQFLAEVHPE